MSDSTVLLFPFQPWHEGVIKSAGGHFPYLSYCLGHGCNGVIYGSPGDTWTFVYRDGQINFSSKSPIYHCAPGDMERLRDNYPDMYSSFYEGKPIEYARFHTVVNMMIENRRQERVEGTCCVPWRAFDMGVTMDLMAGLRNFCVKAGFPLEVWCIPPQIIDEVQKKVMDVCIDLGGVGMDANIFYLLCLRCLVCHIFTDVYGNYRLKKINGDIMTAQLLSQTDLFRLTSVAIVDEEFQKKVEECNRLVGSMVPPSIEQVEMSGPAPDDLEKK